VKTEAQAVKKANVKEICDLRQSHEVNIRKFRHEKNLLTTKIRKLAVEKKKDLSTKKLGNHWRCSRKSWS